MSEYGKPPTRKCKECGRTFYIRRPWQQLCPFCDGKDNEAAEQTDREYQEAQHRRLGLSRDNQ